MRMIMLHVDPLLLAVARTEGGIGFNPMPCPSVAYTPSSYICMTTVAYLEPRNLAIVSSPAECTQPKENEVWR